MTSATTFCESNTIDELVDALRPVANGISADFSKGISLYGAGMVGEWAADFLRKQEANISCFIDGNSAKSGTTVSGIPVYAPVKGVGIDNSLLITARHFVQEICDKVGPEYENVLSFDAYFIVENYTRIAHVRDTMLNDVESVRSYNAILHALLTSTLDACYEVLDKDMYFSLPEFCGNFTETFVDAGAFVGDSVEKFIWENLGTFNHLYAFEPGERQYAAMQKRMDRLIAEWAIDPARVSLEKAGLGEKCTQLECSYVTEDALRHGLQEISEDDTGNDTVPVYALDEYLKGEPVSFIKVDIEGMEMDFLRGARETIRQCRPKIAICIYHYPSDLYEVIEYINDLVPDYRYAVRWHAPVFGDYVLYCY